MKNRIIISDESAEDRGILKSILEKCGYIVIEANNGLEVMNELKISKTGLVITEVNMHGMDGITLLRLMKKDDKFNNIPVIILTTETDDDLITEGRLIGANAWILKPFNHDIFINAVKKILIEQ